MGHITLTAESDAEIRARLRTLLQRIPGGASDADLTLHASAVPELQPGFSHKQPLVGVIMGSDSDLPVMLPAAHILDRFRMPYKLTIVLYTVRPTDWLSMRDLRRLGDSG